MEIEQPDTPGPGWVAASAPGPRVSVVWMDDTYTDMLVHPGLGPDQWAAMLPADVRPKLVCGITVDGLHPGETLTITDVRVLRIDLMTAAIARRRWWWWWQLVRRRVWL